MVRAFVYMRRMKSIGHLFESDSILFLYALITTETNIPFWFFHRYAKSTIDWIESDPP